MHAQLGQITDKKIQKDQKPNCHFWRAGSKNRGSEAKAGHCPCPLHTTPPKGWADHLSHTSNPTPGHTPTLTPYKEPARPASGGDQGNLLFVLAPPLLQQGPNKAWPEFLFWPLINFYWLRKPKNPGWYHRCRHISQQRVLSVWTCNRCWEL